MTCLCGEHNSVEEHLTEEFEIMENLIIINKIRYYEPGLVDNKQPVPDEQYDHFEMRYLQLCYLLNKPNELVHKLYTNIPHPNNPEKDWAVPDSINGTGMFEVDMTSEKVRKVLGLND